VREREHRRARVWANEVGILRGRASALHGADSWEARQWDQLPGNATPNRGDFLPTTHDGAMSWKPGDEDDQNAAANKASEDIS